MKKAIAAILALSLAAPAFAANSDSESVCRRFGTLAASIQDGKKGGMKELEVLTMLQPVARDLETRHAFSILVPFIFKAKMSREELAERVYIKCRAGEFDLKPVLVVEK